jgi:hypothetical protein
MDKNWAPAACTLPTAEQPLRLAEFDQLFTDHLRSADRVDPHTLDLLLTANSRATITELTARENECCSFFTFTLTEILDDRIRLRIHVPSAYAAVLDGLAERLPR